MQLKYLNFYKIIAKFATSIIGSFLPLLIFNATKSTGNGFAYAFLFITAQLAVVMLLDTIFKKLYAKYPQIFLLLRVIPIIAYCLLIMFVLPNNIILGAILIGFFFALSQSFFSLPMENIYNYSSGQNTTSSLGLTRLLEQSGFIAAMILGGLLLDNLPQYVVVIVAIIAYLISVVPLLVYFFKERKSPTFNQEAISNALATYENDANKTEQQKKTTGKLLWGYGFVYFIFCGLDALLNLFLLYLFNKGADSFAAAGFMQAALWGCFGFASMAVSKLDEKKDITWLASLSSIVVAGIVVTLPFVGHIVPLTIVLFGILGLFYSFISYFIYSRFLPRARIMGCSTKAQYARIMGCNLGQMFPGLFCCFGLIALPVFFIIAGCTATYSFLMPINEERNRKALVDYLQNNNDPKTSIGIKKQEVK